MKSTIITKVLHCLLIKNAWYTYSWDIPWLLSYSGQSCAYLQHTMRAIHSKSMKLITWQLYSEVHYYAHVPRMTISYAYYMGKRGELLGECRRSRWESLNKSCILLTNLLSVGLGTTLVAFKALVCSKRLSTRTQRKQPQLRNMSKLRWCGIVTAASLLAQISTVLSDQLVIETPLGYVRGFETW